MKATLLGFAMPPADMAEILRTDATMPTQTATFGSALIAALGSAEVEVTLLSSAPVSSYPLNPRILFHGGPFADGQTKGEKLGFVNVIVLKHVSRFLSCLVRGTRALRRWRPDVLLIHGAHSPYLYYGLLARRMLRVATVVVLTDPPGVVTTTDGRLAKVLKRLDVRLVKRALRGTDGVIALTAALAADFAPGRPALVMEGILSAPAPEPGTHFGPRPADGTFRIMYAGGLLASYGVDRLVRAVRALERDDVRLALYGKGPLSPWIDEQAAADARIEPARFAAREEVLALYNDVDLLVQPRPVDQTFVRYSFPSKLLEYLSSGTPVVSTRLSGIPEEYEPHLSWVDDDTDAGLARALDAVIGLPADARAEKGREGARFISHRCSTGGQGERIRAFLSGLVRP